MEQMLIIIATAANEAYGCVGDIPVAENACGNIPFCRKCSNCSEQNFIIIQTKMKQ